MQDRRPGESSRRASQPIPRPRPKRQRRDGSRRLKAQARPTQTPLPGPIRLRRQPTDRDRIRLLGGFSARYRSMATLGSCRTSGTIPAMGPVSCFCHGQRNPDLDRDSGRAVSITTSLRWSRFAYGRDVLQSRSLLSRAMLASRDWVRRQLTVGVSARRSASVARTHSTTASACPSRLSAIPTRSLK